MFYSGNSAIGSQPSRRDFLTGRSRFLSLIPVVCCLLPDTSYAQADAVKVQPSEPVLFLDDRMIAESAGVTRTFHAVTKHPGNPLLKPDRDWEFQYCIYGSVIYDREGRLFKMWHYGGVVDSVGPNCMYATSQDGLHWDRPVLNLFDVPHPAVDNNIVLASRPGFRPETQTILFEPDDAPEKRYKMLFSAASDAGRHLYIWYSPDGIRFRKGEQFTVEKPGYVDVAVLVQDAVSKRYRLYHRPAASCISSRPFPTATAGSGCSPTITGQGTTECSGRRSPGVVMG